MDVMLEGEVRTAFWIQYERGVSMAETQTGQAIAEERRGLRSTAPFILSGLSGGHGVFHWFSQSFFVMLPEVVAT
ncbi:MAG: hypothetical protein J4N93_01915, partial [Chloroflexi bacterium]|nr:hypothetical protein [Chloroflexota bacterium]